MCVCFHFFQMPQFLYPGHNYLGPGNPLENGEPVDSADKIAKKHDLSYNQATSENDILKSDWESTKEFTSDFFQHPNLPSATGAIGLGLKTGFERIFGVQYPNMSKRPHTPDIRKPDHTPSHFPRTNSGDITSTQESYSSSYIPPTPGADLSQAMDVDSTDGSTQTTRGGGGGGPAAGLITPRSENIFTGQRNPSGYYTRTITKTYSFYADNLPPQFRKVGATNSTVGKDGNDIYLRYDWLNDIPVDRLRTYLSPREEAYYRENFTEVNCDYVQIDIYNKGARGQFTTAGTDIALANMQIQPTIARCHGIDTDFPTRVEETKVADFLGKCTGKSPYDMNCTGEAETWSSALDACSARSVTRALSIPLEIVYPNPYQKLGTGAAAPCIQNKLNTPNIYEYLEMKNGAIMSQEKPCFTYSYKPKNRYLFGRNSPFHIGAFTSTSSEIQPMTNMINPAEYLMRTQHTQDTIKANTNDAAAQICEYVNAFNEQPNNVRIENQFQHNATEVFKPHRMPRFLIGVMPIRNSGEDTNQKIQWEFIMKTTIVITAKHGVPGHYGHTLNYPEPQWMFPNIQKGNYGKFGTDDTAIITDKGTMVHTVSDRRNIFGRPTITGYATQDIAQGVGSTTNDAIKPVAARTRSKTNKS